QVFWSTKPDVSPTTGAQLKDKTHKTKAVRLWFLAVDPSGKHETGPAIGWSNKLTLKHQFKEGVGGKRSVELRVVPEGAIRYTLTGANPAEGTVYNAPFEIGAEETTAYCYAEAGGVTVKKNFLIPKAGNQDVKVDPVKPAKLKHRVDRTGTADSFELLAKARQVKARLGSVTLEIGQGDKSAAVRFGAGTSVTPEQLE